MTEEGHPWVSVVVHKTRLQIAEDPSLNYEYLPLVGLKSFIQSSLELLFGKYSQAIAEKRVRRTEIQGFMTFESTRDRTGGSTLTEAVPKTLKVPSLLY